jgi:hypothetical protein
MHDLIFALLSSGAEHKTQTNKTLRELTIAWSRYGYHGDLIEDSSVDQILMKAAQSSARYCLIQSAGHVIDEQWYLSHWQREGFYQGIQRIIKAEIFLVAGEPLTNEQGSIGLKTDCLLVDLEYYRTFDKPKFGETGDLPAPVEQSQLPTDGPENVPDVSGWHFMQTCIKHDLPLIRFGDAINDCRFDLATGSSTGQFDKLIGKPVDEIDNTKNLTIAQAEFIQRIKKQLKNAQKGAFLFNIESYQDLTQQADSAPLDALFSVAAGFKPYRILFSQGFHADTQVVLFDYSLKALEIRRYIVENWDGVDFPSFVRQLFKRYPQQNVFYQLWYDTTPDTLDWNDMEHLWQQELEKWGGAAAFKHHWQQCRQLPHQYLHCDLLQNRQTLLNELSRYDNSYIWWSNAFFTIFSHWHYSPTERKAHYLDWITALSVAAPNCQVNGADHNNIAVNGLSARQYFLKFNQQHCDELTPQKHHSIEIQF